MDANGIQRSQMKLPQPSSALTRLASAFTLMELLIVLAIMGLLAAIALPAMKGLQKSNTAANATQQLLSDLALARQTAIRERTAVHVVFVPPTIPTMNHNTTPGPAGVRDTRQWNNLLTGAYSTYALFAERTVGDQPGQRRFRYLTGWRTLPDGMFIADWEFDSSLTANPALWFSTPTTNRPFKFISLPFPTEGGLSNFVPHVAFDANGSLLAFDQLGSRDYTDEVINLSRCSLFFNRDPAGQVIDYDYRETPVGNSKDTYNRIRIDGLTGRARVEQPKIQ